MDVWRRGWDSNPRTRMGLLFSRQVHSTRLCDPSKVCVLFFMRIPARWVTHLLA